MKKIIFVFSLIIFPLNSVYAGLVPCTATTCTLCHFFQMISNVITFIQQLAAPVAVLMIVIGGIFMTVSYISPNAGGENLTKARNIFKAVAVGLIIIWGGWIILNLFLTTIGVSPTWYQITC